MRGRTSTDIAWSPRSSGTAASRWDVRAQLVVLDGNDPRKLLLSFWPVIDVRDQFTGRFQRESRREESQTAIMVVVRSKKAA
jgi:hypothetical protein